VRRQIYSDKLTQPVVVDSVYNRTADVAEWNINNNSRPVVGNTNATNSEFILRDGETLVAVLNNDLTTKTTKPGDRFAMTVRQPSQYEEAVIEGTVGSVDEGGRLSGRSEMSLTFDTIRLRNGQTYRFAGILESVRTLNGDAIKVDNEGSAQGANKSRQTIQRAGVATAVGAIIGAIAGGGKGAAIGGIIAPRYQFTANRVFAVSFFTLLLEFPRRCSPGWYDRSECFLISPNVNHDGFISPAA